MINVDKASTAMLDTVFDDQDDEFWESFNNVNAKSWEGKRFSRGIASVLSDANVRTKWKIKATVNFWRAAGTSAWPAFVGMLVGMIIGLVVGVILAAISGLFLWGWLAWLAKPICVLFGAVFGFDWGDKRLAAEYFS